MWKPATVVPEHRKRATVVWGALLLAIVGYTAWQIVALDDKYDHPSTNFSVSDEVYEFPTLDICVWGGKGCDESLEESTCIGTAGFSVYDPCFEETEDLETTSQGGNCVAFDLSRVDMQGFANGCAVSKKPSTLVTMAWVASHDPYEEEDYRAVVGIFLGNESTPEYVTVPYSRVIVTPDRNRDEVTYIETDMTIGKSTRNTIEGDSATSYPILSVSTGDFVDLTPTALSNVTVDNSTYAVGYLHLTLTQGGFSLTELTDINPIDLATLLGNIGGFWEILLVTWGLCFIASRAESPTQKGRDFTQPIQIGKEIVSRKRRRSSTVPATFESEGCVDERSYWNTAGRGRPGAPSGRSITAIPSVGARPPTNVSASFFRHPIQQDIPRPSFSASPGPLVTSGSPVKAEDRQPTSQQNQPPSYADCA